MNLWRKLVIAVTALAACSGDENAKRDASGPTEPVLPPVVATIVITPGQATLTSLGDVVQLSASARDQGGVPMSGVTFAWSSSDDGVATVDADGSVEATGNGEVTVSATVGSVRAHASISVRQVAASLELTPASATIAGLGATSDFRISVLDEGGSPVAAASAVWASLNSNVVSMTSVDRLTGRATGERDGQAIVEVTADGLKEYAVVNVISPAQGPERTWIEDPGPAGTLYAVWGSAPDDVWAVGRFGVIRHYDGTAWRDATPGLTTEGLFDVWGTGPTDVWAVGGGPVILHYDGVAWSDVSAPRTGSSLHGVWGAAPNDVWAACDFCEALRFDGDSWTSGGSVSGLRDLWGAARAAIWAPGLAGAIRAYDGIGWTTTYPSHVGSAALLGVWGTGDDDVWVVGDGGSIARFDGAAWHDASTPTIGIPRLEGVWGSGPSDVWVVGSTWIFHFDGTDWTAIASGTAGRLLDVWGSAAGDVWVVGEGMILRGVVGPIARIDDVALSTTTLTLDGPAASYVATVTNLVGGTVSPVILQAFIDQGSASRAANGTGVNCGLPSDAGDLPPGSCSFDFTLSATNGAAGSGTLVPGDATARFELILDGDVLDTLTLAVTLVG